MNAKDRKQISKMINNLEETKTAIENLMVEEENKYDNLPEGIQDSERGEAIQNAIDNLESASDSIGDAIDYLNEAME